MTQYYDSQNRVVSTGNQVGRGGEGTVFTVQGNNDLVAKIWTKPDQIKAEKITAIIRSQTATTPGTPGAKCAWPQDLLINHQGEPVGYLMPMVDTSEFDQSFAYYNKSQRDRTERKHGIRIGQAILVTAAYNLALAVSAVHRAGHIVGDVNEKNVLVNRRGDVVIVDMDSIQAHDQQTRRTYLCEVAREDYTPPRMQGMNFHKEPRTVDDDCFGLAVLIFKLIMGGMHPFSSVVEPDDQNAIAQLGEKIKQQLFPYNEDATVPHRYKVAAPEYKAAWDNARDEIKTLFREAFDPFYIKNNPRPGPEKWARVLERELEIIKQGGGASKASNPTAGQLSQRSKPPIVQGAKEDNQKEVQGALNHLLDDLKSLVLAYARQGIQEKIWSFDNLRTIPAQSVANIRSPQHIQQSGDLLALLHTLASITPKLVHTWTRQKNIHPSQIREVVDIRNNIHNLQQFADAGYTTRALRSIENLHDGIKEAPRPWPSNAVWKGNQNTKTPPPHRAQQVSKPPTNQPKPQTGPKQTSAAAGRMPPNSQTDFLNTKVLARTAAAGGTTAALTIIAMPLTPLPLAWLATVLILAAALTGLALLTLHSKIGWQQGVPLALGETPWLAEKLTTSTLRTSMAGANLIRNFMNSLPNNRTRIIVAFGALALLILTPTICSINMGNSNNIEEPAQAPSPIQAGVVEKSPTITAITAPLGEINDEPILVTAEPTTTAPPNEAEETPPPLTPEAPATTSEPTAQPNTQPEFILLTDPTKDFSFIQTSQDGTQDSEEITNGIPTEETSSRISDTHKPALKSPTPAASMPTPTRVASATHAPMPTLAPTLIPTATPVPTPTATPTPTPTPQASLTLEDDKYAISYGHGMAGRRHLFGR